MDVILAIGQNAVLPVVIAWGAIVLKGRYDLKVSTKAQAATEAQSKAARESAEKVSRDNLQAQLDLKRLEYKIEAYDDLVRDAWHFHTLLRDLVTLPSPGLMNWHRLARFEEHHPIHLATRAPHSVLTALSDYYKAANRIYDLAGSGLLFTDEPMDISEYRSDADDAFERLMKAVRADQYQDDFVPPLPNQEVFRIGMRERANQEEVESHRRADAQPRTARPRVRPLARRIRRPLPPSAGRQD